LAAGNVNSDVKALSLCLLAPLFLGAQIPRIGLIDFYGLREVSREQVQGALGFKEGDPLPSSKGDVEERLEQVRGVVRARLQAVCCEAGDAIVFVGIEEKGAPHYNFRFPPEKDAALPGEIVETYTQFLEALERSARKGETAESFAEGHALAANPELRALQVQFIAHAKKHLTALRDVLRNSADGEHRAIAAHVIGYAPDKREIVNDLQYAMQDPDDDVRNNAMRALGAIVVLARRDPEAGIKVSPTWFTEMLNSIIWTDRSKAAMALVSLTDSRDARVLDQIRDRALPSLVEMARWKSLSHAWHPFLLVGRLAGLPEKQIMDAWSKGERERVIAKALGERAGKK